MHPYSPLSWTVDDADDRQQQQQQQQKQQQQQSLFSFHVYFYS